MMACMVNQPAARTLAALLSLLPATAIAQAIDPSGVTGTRILGGGGKLPASIHERFVSLAGGNDAHIVLVPTASKRADNPSDRQRLLARWRESHPDAHFEVLHTRDRTVADSERFTAPLRRATGIWFGGGSQSRIAKAYVSTRFEDEMHSLLKRGGDAREPRHAVAHWC